MNIKTMAAGDLHKIADNSPAGATHYGSDQDDLFYFKKEGRFVWIWVEGQWKEYDTCDFELYEACHLKISDIQEQTA